MDGLGAVQASVENEVKYETRKGSTYPSNSKQELERLMYRSYVVQERKRQDQDGRNNRSAESKTPSRIPSVAAIKPQCRNADKDPRQCDPTAVDRRR